MKKFTLLILIALCNASSGHAAVRRKYQVRRSLQVSEDTFPKEYDGQSGDTKNAASSVKGGKGGTYSKSKHAFILSADSPNQKGGGVLYMATKEERDEMFHKGSASKSMKESKSKSSVTTGTSLDDGTGKEGGMHKEGASKMGMSNDGANKMGMSNDGANKMGTSNDGANKMGTSNDGANKMGMSKDGANKMGMSKDGANKMGMSKDGATKAGISKDGADQIIPTSTDEKMKSSTDMKSKTNKLGSGYSNDWSSGDGTSSIKGYGSKKSSGRGKKSRKGKTKGGKSKTYKLSKKYSVDSYSNSNDSVDDDDHTLKDEMEAKGTNEPKTSGGQGTKDASNNSKNGGMKENVIKGEGSVTKAPASIEALPSSSSATTIQQTGNARQKIGVQLSPFTLTYNLGGQEEVPSTEEYELVHENTFLWLFTIMYRESPTGLDNLIIEDVTNVYSGGNGVRIEYKMVALFNADTENVPSTAELDKFVASAFTDENLQFYLEGIQNFPEDNFFRATSLIRLQNPDAPVFSRASGQTIYAAAALVGVISAVAGISAMFGKHRALEKNRKKACPNNFDSRTMTDDATHMVTAAIESVETECVSTVSESGRKTTVCPTTKSFVHRENDPDLADCYDFFQPVLVQEKNEGDDLSTQLSMESFVSEAERSILGIRIRYPEALDEESAEDEIRSSPSEVKEINLTEDEVHEIDLSDDNDNDTDAATTSPSLPEEEEISQTMKEVAEEIDLTTSEVVEEIDLTTTEIDETIDLTNVDG